jgi:glucose/arabinose dehydrogenase
VHRATRPALAIAAVLLLAACGSAANNPGKTWVPKPAFSGDGGGTPDQPGGGSGGGGVPGQPGGGGGQSGGPARSGSPVVATKLKAPTGVAILPDNTALVGERTTGRIVRVQSQSGQPVTTVRTLGGLSTTGGGGLLDLALSPDYNEDGLIFAYITTPTDNRVVDFTLHGPVTPVLTGIPRGASDNTGRITIGPHGDLYVGTGDAGKPSLAANPKSLAGKVLRITEIGKPAPGNPNPKSPIFTSGHHVVNGLCTDSTTMFEVETQGARGTDNINALRAGHSYGYPTPKAGASPPIATLPIKDRGPGGCAIIKNVLFVTSLSGQALLATTLNVTGSTPAIAKFSTSLVKKYGRLLTVVAAPDGALWLTTSNRDGRGKPVPSDERVIRIVPSGASGKSPA